MATPDAELAGLEAVLRQLDARAEEDPRLGRYRVPGRDDALHAIPPGWHVSSAIERIAVHGGWWPGEWGFPSIRADVVGGWLTLQDTDDWVGEVRWTGIGTIWERDHFFTPMTRTAHPSAPVLGLSNQALWASLVFPCEEALLAAFLVTYEELGLDENGFLNPFFVEWIVDEPSQDEPVGARRAATRIQQQAEAWSTTHPCWNPDVMPLLSGDAWPTAAVTAALGLLDP